MMTRIALAALLAGCPAAAQTPPAAAPRPPDAGDTVRPGGSVAPALGRTMRDPFYWLGEFNKASTVMVVERGIVTPALGTVIAKAVAQVIADGNKPGARRPADYLQYEPLLVAVAGPDVTRMHSGRSRQDILATTRRVMQRDRLLALLDAMDAARTRLIGLAAANQATIVPAYTNGVQAQPTSYAHYLLGFAAAYARDAERLRQAYARLNLSPMGSAALGTSSFPVDRPRLAALLGFDGVDENSFGADQLAAIDEGAELAGLAGTMALTTGSFVQDIHTQYHQSSPWILLQEGGLTGTSSIMPQKRNPYGLNVLRLSASDVLGAATTFLFEAHNVTTGMPDYKREGSQHALEAATRMFADLTALLGGLVIDPARALAEVDGDYSATTELADTLQRVADVPFRVGHHFASALVDYGRANRLTPAQIPFSEAQRIFAASAAAFPGSGTVLPLSEAQFRTSLSARGMVEASQGLGGPQPASVTRMLSTEQARLAADETWLTERRAALAAAQHGLDDAFAKVAEGPTRDASPKADAGH